VADSDLQVIYFP